MEDNKPEQPITAPPPTPVMDIQPAPKPPEQPSAPVAETPAAEAIVPETAVPQAVEAPSPTAPPAAPAPDPAPVTDEAAPAEPLAAKPIANHHTVPIGAILVAVFVAIALGVVSVIAYQSSNKQSETKAPAQQSTTQTPAVTGSDVDATSKAVDDSLGQVDETTEFDTNSLSDTVLDL